MEPEALKSNLSAVERSWLSARRCAAAALASLVAVVGVAEMAGQRANAAARPPASLKVTMTANGTPMIDGAPRFLIGAGWLSAESVPKALELGINTFQSRKPGTEQAALSRAVGNKGEVIPEHSPKNLAANYPNAIGFTLEDEADANGYLPPSRNPDPNKKYLPKTERTAKTGELIVQTLTSRFMSGQPKIEGIGEAEYQAYADNADMLLTDPYPLAHGCVDLSVNRLSIVYDAMVELKALAPNKTVGEWIETGGIEGYCGVNPVSPQTAPAEAWAAVAGGAQTIDWFTYSWVKGYEDQFDISPEMATSIKITDQELQKYSPILLAKRLANVVSATDDPVKVGLRVLDGQAYLIAVNLSGEPVDLSKDSLAQEWWGQLPGLQNQVVSDISSGQLLKAKDGRFEDRLNSLDIGIYTWNLPPATTTKKNSKASIGFYQIAKPEKSTSHFVRSDIF